MPSTTDAVECLSESNASELVLALDAGGSKTSAWLVEAAIGGGHRILGRGRSSAGNPHSVGFTAATRAISEAIDRARNDAQCHSAAISRAVLSIAGTIDSVTRDQFIRWSRKVGVAERTTIVPDVLPVLAAGTPLCCGVALISGTGSSAFARSADGRTSLCGGWGYLLGDAGSGFAIGRAAIRGALDDEEMNAPQRPLTAAMIESLNVGSATEMAKTIYRSADPRATVASLAPLAVRAAEEGEGFATALVDGAACDLAALASRAARAVGLADGSFALAVTGGVLVSSKRLQRQLATQLRAAGMNCQLDVVEEPLEGCLRLADPKFADVLAPWHQIST